MIAAPPMPFSNEVPAQLFRRRRAIPFILAVLIYAVSGSPTPDNPGLIELLIGMLLIIAASPVGIIRSWHKEDEPAPAYWGSAVALGAYGFTISLAIALFADHEIIAIIRDLASFIFLLFPLFFLSAIRRNYLDGDVLIAGTIIIGIAFALRSLLQALDDGLLVFLSRDPLYYLANSPCVLFAAIWLGAQAIKAAGNPATIKSMLLMALAVLASGACVMALIITLQRASTGLWVFSLAMIFILHFLKAPYRYMGWLVVLICAGVFFSADMAAIYGPLMEKTHNVGANMRLQELAAVWAVITASPLSFIFGTGWGAMFASPAVGNMSVNFTHGLLGSILLKTGICGTLLTFLYIAALVRPMANVLKTAPGLFFALLCPLFIDIFLYAAFKSLDFGLLLLILAALSLKKQD